MKKIISLCLFLLPFLSLAQIPDANINTDINYVRTHGFDPPSVALPMQDLENSKIGTIVLQATGTDTYIVSTFNTNISAYLSGTTFPVYFQNGNTGAAATLKLGTLATKTLVKNTSTTLASGDIASGGRLHWVYYDGTNFRISLWSTSGALIAANNLSDVANAATSRTNLGAQAALVSGTNIKTINSTSLLGSGDIAIAGGSSLAPTAVKTSNYTAAVNDLVPVDATSGNIVITLPTAPADKSQIAVKMIAVTAGTYTTTINTGGSDLYNKVGGGTTLSLILLNQAVILQYKSSGAIWYVLSDDLALSQLDLRFANLASPALTGTPTAPQINIGTPISESFSGRALVARGNSVFYGFTTLPAGKESIFGAAYLLANKLGLSANVTGVSGQTAQTYATSLLANTPTYSAGSHKYLIFEWGINDGNGGRTDVQFSGNMTTIVNDAISKGWPASSIYILGVPGSCYSCSGFQVAYDAALQTLATSVGANFVAVWSQFVNNIYPGRANITDGSLHPNNEGHQMLADIIYNAINRPFDDLNSKLNVKGGITTDNLRIYDLPFLPNNPYLMGWDSLNSRVGVAQSLRRGMRTNQSFWVGGNLQQIGSIRPSSGFAVDDWNLKYTARIWSSNTSTVWAYFDLFTTGGKTNIANGSTGGINFLTGNTNPVQQWRVDGTTGAWVGEYQRQIKIDGGGSLIGTFDLMTAGLTQIANTYTLGTYSYKGYDGSGGNNSNQTWHLMDRTNGSTFTLPLVVTPFTVASTTGKPAVIINPAASTALTASAELPDFKINTRTKQYATGALTRERTFYSKGQTIGFVGASTLADSYNGIFYSNIQGTNATITRNWALSSKGNLQVTGSTYHGDSLVAATAKVHIAAGTTSASSGPIKLTEGVNPTSAEDGIINYVNNNVTFTETSTVYTLAKTLTNTATLDFGSTAAGAATDLTITVTGAVDGDPVSLGVPNASTLSDGAFSAWVSATNTVTVRFANNNLVTALDPASGTFRASIIHY